MPVLAWLVLWLGVGSLHGDEAAPRSGAADATLAMKQTDATPPAPGRGTPAAGRYSWLWIPAAIALYFALQLWILPRLGVPT